MRVSRIGQGLNVQWHESARASTFNGMTRNKIMEWMHGRRDPMKFVEAAEEIAHSRKKSMIDSSLSYQKDTSGSKVAAVTSHVDVMTPEMHQLFKTLWLTPEMHQQLFKTLWKDSKAKTTNIVIGQPKKKIVKPAQKKGKKCAQANV